MVGNATPTQNASRGGISLLGATFLVLLVLKAIGYLPNLSWVWVFAPLWIPLAVVAVILVAIGLWFIFDHFRMKRRYNKRFK